MEKKPLKGIKAAFRSLRSSKTLTNQEIEVLSTFADKFTTVSTHPGIVGQDVSEIAKEVNLHHHTHTCRKYGKECRFGFEKLPSPETIIAQPVKGTTETKKKLLKKCHETTKKVREVLDDKEEIEKIMQKFNKEDEVTPEEIKQKRLERIKLVLKKAGVTMDDYLTVLKTSLTGYSVILARDIDELSINNFNQEWLRAWNANLDLQICLDFHAVVTYITDYYSKCETELVKMIKEVLAKSEATDNKARMKIVGDVFQRSRQMGEAEAVYKLIPNMQLSNSNVTCQWVSTGLATDRSSRYLKAQIEHIEAGIPLVELEGHEGLWFQQQDIWSKYLRRPAELRTICFAQFAKMYRGSSKNVADDEDIAEDDLDTDITDMEDADENFDLRKFDYIMTYETDSHKRVRLKEYIQLNKPIPGESSCMQKRKSPVALRFHKIKQSNDSEMYIFSEVMLYYPLEEELTIEMAKQFYEEKYKSKRKVDIVKGQVMEFLESVTEARYHLEMLENEVDLSDVARLLDAQGEQDNEETEELEVEISAFDHLNPDDLHISNDKSNSSGLYKRIIIPTDAELRRTTRQLDKHQREVLNTVIKYAKDIVKSRNRMNKLPTPPCLMMHGGAGAGKSTVIRITAQWVQKILQVEGQDVNCPSVVITAFCGTAASNVDGQTLHSSFGFSFGNQKSEEHQSLGDKTRDFRRTALRYLKLVIIDEVSMVKADMLYQLDLRLQEITQKIGVPFGGVGILAFGDLMQLPPCMGRDVFQEPANSAFLITHKISPRWGMFKSILLEENHRQGNDRSYAELLNRIRVKEHTEEDMEVLKRRVRTPTHSDIINASLYITAKRKPCDLINEKYISKLKGTPLKLKAIHHHPINPDFKPFINAKDQTVGETGFRDELILKPGARIILIHNLDTIDSLTNGQLGTFIDAVKDTKGKVVKLILKLDKAGAGAVNRQQNPELAKKFPDYVFIQRVSLQYSMSKKTTESSKATVIQFPIRLAYGITAHKIQGSSIPFPNTVALDISSVFQAGQAYVMLSRVQCLEQVFIVGKIEESKIRMSNKALEELQRLQSISMNRNPTVWMKPDCGYLKIASVNCAGLNAHFEDIKSDSRLLTADIILLQETSLITGEIVNLDIPSHPVSVHVRQGRGKGVSMYMRKEYDQEIHTVSDGFQILKVKTNNMDIFNVYRSSNGCKETLCLRLEDLIDGTQETLILGDFNICSKSEKNNSIQRCLQGHGLKQIVKEATHIRGRMIDHIYLKNHANEAVVDLERYSPYYTDHDALLLTLNPN